MSTENKPSGEPNKVRPTLAEQIAYMQRRSEYSLSPYEPGNDIEAAILATLRVSEQITDALRYVRINIGSVPPHKILARADAVLRAVELRP
jgi:hypothetical protein